MAREDESYEPEEDLPRRRRRRDEDDEQIEAGPPRRRRRRDEDDDYEDRPRKRRRRQEDMNWLDQQFTSTALPLLLLFPLCCGIFAFFFGLAGAIGCTDDKARRNALIVLVISVVWLGVVTLINIARLSGAH